MGEARRSAYRTPPIAMQREFRRIRSRHELLLNEKVSESCESISCGHVSSEVSGWHWINRRTGTARLFRRKPQSDTPLQGESMAKIDAFFKLMNEQKASDVHLVSGQQPVLRIRGDLERVKYKVLDDNELRSMLYEITPEDKIKVFEETGDLDFAYEIPGLARYRVNFFMQKNGIGAVFREIPSEILTVEQLGLPPVISRLALLPRGIVIVTGPTGSGKSTTLAAIIDEANRKRKDHIITIEDPIEFVHTSKNCVINHREVGTHTRSFSAALRAALREDPDIILVGEMRDLETMRLAIEAAATGHLVFSTLHTTSAAKTVDRIIEVFPSGRAGADSLHPGRRHPGCNFPGTFQTHRHKGAHSGRGDTDSNPRGAGDDSRIQNPSDPIGASDRKEIRNADPG